MHKFIRIGQEMVNLNLVTYITQFGSGRSKITTFHFADTDSVDFSGLLLDFVCEVLQDQVVVMDDEEIEREIPLLNSLFEQRKESIDNLLHDQNSVLSEKQRLELEKIKAYVNTISSIA